MYKQYTETFKEIGKYIFFLEETILNYEQKCIDMGLEDMLEPSYSVCPVCKSKQKDHECEYKSLQIIPHQSEEEWAYSKTEGNDDEARREALAKCQTRSDIELKKLDSLEK